MEGEHGGSFSPVWGKNVRRENETRHQTLWLDIHHRTQR